MCQRKEMATYIRGEMEEWMKETKREGETGRNRALGDVDFRARSTLSF